MASEPVLFVATISTLLLQTKNEAIGELADVRSQPAAPAEYTP